MPGMNSRNATPLSLTALAIIAILVLVLHVARSDMLDRPHAHSSMVAPGDGAQCTAETKPPVSSLPFD